MQFMKLTIPEHAYMFGFIQADGHIALSDRNRGKVSLELNYQDEDILKKFKEIIPYNSTLSERTRETNFSNEIRSATLTVCDIDFRTELISLGIPSGKKSDTINIPEVKFSKVDYFRGIIDANGSLGITSKNIPFLSLVTPSESLANSFIDFIQEVTGKLKTTSRNERDKVFNIAIYKEDAQQLVSMLYYPRCLALSRKLDNANKVADWVRPDGMSKITFERRTWSKEEDQFIVTHSLSESVKELNRTEKSIKIRVWRLQNK